MMRLLWAQALGLTTATLLMGHGVAHTAVHVTAIFVCVAAASSEVFSPRTRSTACALGLVACSAVLVHLAGGFIEAHFHFFVMVALMSLYQAWAPFGAAVGFVALHHSLLGWLAPQTVFNHQAAVDDPLLWSGIHGGLLLAASVAALVTWRLNEHQALHDALTGLPNRALLSERLAAVYERQGDRPIGVLFVDLDDFKGVNDTGGHARGDELLVQVARRLETAVREGDLVARLGGDEFAVLLERVEDRRAASEVARRILATLTTPFEVAEREIVISASIGIALRDREDEVADVEEMLSQADLAMYVAKRRGKAQYEVFDFSMHAALVSRLELEVELRRAVEEQQFVLHYQPIMSLSEDRVLGTEVLVRWDHPTRGLVPPDEFIPLAEDSGLIVPIGSWVLERSCVQMAAWNAQRPGAPLYLSVNLSPRQLRSGIVDTVAGALERSGLDPRQLVLEVTESAFVDDDADVEALHALRELGVRLAVDDFGTGYSSLNYLRRLPVDVVKIDRSFVRELSHGSDDEALVDAIVRLCRALGMLVIAEGVETPGEASVLAGLGAPAAQGYLFARPSPATDLEELLGASADPAVLAV